MPEIYEEHGRYPIGSECWSSDTSTTYIKLATKLGCHVASYLYYPVMMSLRANQSLEHCAASQLNILQDYWAYYLFFLHTHDRFHLYDTRFLSPNVYVNLLRAVCPWGRWFWQECYDETRIEMPVISTSYLKFFFFNYSFTLSI